MFPGPYPTPLTVAYHRVTVDIDNGVARTSVDQEFVNETDQSLSQGRYVFPVPEGAVVGEFAVEVDGAVKQAEVMGRETATELFRQAMVSSKDAALLDYGRNGAYAVSLTPIAPGGRQRVVISYEEVLGKEDGLSRYLYPLSTERFSMGLIDSVVIDVTIRNQGAITSVYSPSHTVELSRQSSHTVRALYRAVSVRPNRDFELFYKLSDSDISFHLFTYKESGHDGYYLMLITPRYREASASDEIVAKDMVFTIDRSGSMSYTKIEQAREALRFCVDNLRGEDRFSIVTFASEVTSFTNDLTDAAPGTVADAHTFVDGIAANGGTDIESALRRSMGMMVEGSRPNYVIFLTDGKPTAGITFMDDIVTNVLAANVSGARLYSVGFGYDVNSVLIDRLSEGNGGYALYCDPTDNIETVIGDLYRRIATPVLTDPLLTVEGVETYAMLPEKLGDLFDGTEIAVYGRYRGRGSATVSLSGTAKTGAVSLSYPAFFPGEHTDYDFVPRLWATRKIAALMTAVKTGDYTREEKDAKIDTIETLSVTYGIVTPYTSALFTGSGGGTQGTVVYETLTAEDGRAANDVSNYKNAAILAPTADMVSLTDTAARVSGPAVNELRTTGDKIFVYTADSVWRDAGYDSSLAADTVYFGSSEYFALADANAKAADYLTVGNAATFTMGTRNVVVLDTGIIALPIGPGRGESGPAAGGRTRFSALRHGGAVRFAVPRGEGGAIRIYDGRGKAIVSLRVAPDVERVRWTPGAPVAAGAYIAVYERGGRRTSLRLPIVQ
jgi:Ca-activated chloride channel family protein